MPITLKQFQFARERSPACNAVALPARSRYATALRAGGQADAIIKLIRSLSTRNRYKKQEKKPERCPRNTRKDAKKEKIFLLNLAFLSRV